MFYVVANMINFTAMNMFIDTSVIYTDPFWKRNFASQVLDSAKEKRSNIFISDLVIRELRHNYEKQLNKEIISIKNSNLTISKLVNRHKNTDLPVIAEYLAEFDKYYNNLFKFENIILLKSSKDYFEELVDRAIEKTKPFSETRSEFKDAVIWFTYYKYAKLKKLNDCHLITTNVTDFAVSKKQIELHNFDALELIEKIPKGSNNNKTIFYFDPPYYLKGSSLYMNHYKDDQHKEVSNAIERLENININWIISYDNTPEIKKVIYKWVPDHRRIEYSFNHSAYKPKQGKEILFFSKNLIYPKNPLAI